MFDIYGISEDKDEFITEDGREHERDLWEYGISSNDAGLVDDLNDDERSDSLLTDEELDDNSWIGQLSHN